MFRVLVKNFQSIASATIEVAGFTAITGTNNSGKSALIRAIRGLLQNAKGTAFIRHGEAKAVVEMFFDRDGRSAQWEKGRAKRDKPTYFLDGKLDKPLHPGQAVPDEVRALGIHPITAGGREVWPQIAPQFSGQVFLLDQPGSVLAEAVADVSRVSQLNDALRSAQSDKLRAVADLRVRRGDKGELETQLVSYKGLDEAVVLVELVEEGSLRVLRIQSAISGLGALMERLTGAQGTVERLSGIEKVEIPLLGDAGALLDERDSLMKLQQSHLAAARQVEHWAGVEEVDTDFDFSVAEKVLAALQILLGLQDRWTAATERVQELERELAATESAVEEATSEFHEMLGGMGECPLCGSTEVAHDHGGKP